MPVWPFQLRGRAHVLSAEPWTPARHCSFLHNLIHTQGYENQTFEIAHSCVTSAAYQLLRRVCGYPIDLSAAGYLPLTLIPRLNRVTLGNTYKDTRLTIAVYLKTTDFAPISY